MVCRTALWFSIGLSLSACSATSAPSSILGTYVTVSESEWHQSLSLLPDGKAEITAKSWEPGRFSEAVALHVVCNWKLKNELIELACPHEALSVRYSPRLSFSSLGIPGGAAGVQKVVSDKPENSSVLTSQRLWAESAVEHLWDDQLNERQK